MRAGADRDGRGGSDVRRLHVEAPGIADLNPLVATIGHVHVCPVRRKRSSASVSTGPAQCLSSPAISRTCRSHQTRRGANCPSRRNEDVSGGIPSHGGRTAIVKVIVGSAGCPPNRVPTPAHPAHPSSRPPFAAAFKATGVDCGCARASISKHAADRPRVAVGRPRLFSSWRSSRLGARAGCGTLYETDRSVLCARVMRPARRSLCAPPGFLMRRAISAHRSPT